MPELSNKTSFDNILERLEKGFHEQQTAFMTTRDEVNTLKSAYNVIQRDIMSLANSVEKLVARFEDGNKTNWPMLALLAGMAPILIGGMAFFMTSFTANAVAPIHSEVVQTQTTMKALADQVKEIATIQNTRGGTLQNLSTTVASNHESISRMMERERRLEDQVAKSASSDDISRTDRVQLNDRVKKLEQQISSEIADRRQQSAEVRVQLGEIEQQFHSVSNLENLRAAYYNRNIAMLWEKTHPGERFPTDNFFPTSIFQGPGGAPSMPANGLKGGE